MDEGLEVGLCAAHPKRASVGTCTRCGNHACARCWDFADTLWASCLPEHGSYRVPWESTAWSGFARTVRDVLLSPIRFFGRAGPARSFVRPLEFALIVWVVVVLSMTMLGTLLRDGDLAEVTRLQGTVMTAFGAAVGVGIAVLHGLVLWVVGAALRVSRPLRATVRAAAYAQASRLLFVAATWLALPFGRPTFGIVGLGALILVCVHETIAFGSFLRGRQGPFARAHLAGAVVASLWPALVLWLVLAQAA